MANNIVGGAPNAIVAKSTVTFATAGITALNTEIIYLVGDPLKSYVPGRAINGISGFETGKGYYMVAKTNMDLEAIVVPPLDGVTPPTDDWTDFDFTTISPSLAITESPANTWILGSGAIGGYGNKGLATVKFAAGVDGAIICQFPDLSTGNAVFGVSDTNAVAAYSEMEAAFWHGYVTAPGVGVISTTTNGNSPSNIAAGDWVGIFRTGSVLKLRKSPDKTNWTDLLTFTFSSSGILYPVVDMNSGSGKLVNPQYQGLTT